MLSYDTKSKLAALLLSISTGEQEIETFRQKLCRHHNFEPYAAFLRIDRSQSGLISPTDLQAFLAEHRKYYNTNDCAVFITKSDINTETTDPYLNYTQFMKALLPNNHSYLRTATAQRKNYRPSGNQLLPYPVEWSLANLIDKYPYTPPSFILIYLIEKSPST